MKVSGEYTVIPPIIADLDGNGVNEVVLITKDLELKVGIVNLTLVFTN
jgi:hypothetical protein